MTTTRTPRLLGAVVLVVLAGCTTEPAPAPSPSPTASTAAPEAVDPDVEALAAVVAELRATVTALRTELEAAAGGETGSLQRAATLLAADVDAVTDPSTLPDEDDETGADGDAPTASAGTGDQSAPEPIDPGEPAPLLPGPLASRAESIQYGDLLTRTLATARSAGDDGSAVLRFLADPLAGDLGAWQRAPDDQLAAIGDAASAGDLAAAEQEILQLAGEAPRALGWVAHGLEVSGDAEAAAGRALAHLAIIELALDQLA